ncbi:TfoX/Sxy family protein [Rhizobium sp. TRM95111]|uniref:TfoX/Sxy family protein n=1 Tax=Rhizobium alarense TaxID=2846851 RepID=UPI001F24140F|nr:TfoX/Sxy family protein [Rhizobium alarense]MCF3638714.1 TfoX/Sxy family protein [Rhizobium alarense]
MPRPAKPEIVAWLEGELAPLGGVSAKRFFGGWDLRQDGGQFAIVMEGTLYLKVNDDLRARLLGEGGRTFRYDKTQSTVTVAKYVSVPETVLDDPDTLRDLAREAIRAFCGT